MSKISKSQFARNVLLASAMLTFVLFLSANASAFATIDATYVNGNRVSGDVPITLASGRYASINVELSAYENAKSVIVKAWFAGQNSVVKTKKFNVIADKTYPKSLKIMTPRIQSLTADSTLFISVENRDGVADAVNIPVIIQKDSYERARGLVRRLLWFN